MKIAQKWLLQVVAGFSRRLHFGMVPVIPSKQFMETLQTYTSALRDSPYLKLCLDIMSSGSGYSELKYFQSSTLKSFS